MAKKALPSPEVLRQLLRYEPESGDFYWMPRTGVFFPATCRSDDDNAAAWNGRYAGQKTLHFVNRGGYLFGMIFARYALAHRVAFAMHHDGWPDGQIDHIDGDKQNNRISNLRDVSSRENMQNAPMPSTNTSGAVGVFWRPREKRWAAVIVINRKPVGLGFFADKIDAINARKNGEIRYGFHANHGRPANARTQGGQHE